MTKWLSIFLRSLLSLFQARRDLAFENLVLRQQLAVLKEKGGRAQVSTTNLQALAKHKAANGWPPFCLIAIPTSLIMSAGILSVEP